MHEPQTCITLEAPGGLIKIVASCSDGEVEKVSVTNVASFVSQLDAVLEVEGVGTIKVDTAYGGDSFVIVNAPDLGFSVVPDEARAIAEIGVSVVRAANEQLGFTHPENPDWSHISFCQMAMPVVVEGGTKQGRNAVAIMPGKIDRSPCGTGCSARLAVLRARGEIGVDESFRGVSIIGSTFDCSIVADTNIGSLPAILPRIAGRAYITGTHQHTLSSADPWPEGYRVSDTWPGL